MASPDQRLLDEMILHRVGLERFSNHVVEKVDQLLSAAQVEMETALRQGLSGVSSRGRDLSPSARQHLQDTLDRVRAIQREAHAALDRSMKSDWSELAQHEVEWAARLYGEGAGVLSTLDKPSATLLASIALSDPLGDKSLEGWVKHMTAEQVRKVTDQIRLGMIQGESVDQIAKRLTGSPETGFRAGIFPGSLNSARILVRTSVNHVSNRAHEMFLTENPSVFPRYKWISVLDERTSQICRSLSGQIFDSGKGPLPPAHPACRSTIIGIPIGLDDVPMTKYGDWLRRQPRASIDDIMGKARAKLFLEGRLPMERFISRKGDALTLDQLKVREAQSWKRAFGAGGEPGAPGAPGASGAP